MRLKYRKGATLPANEIKQRRTYSKTKPNLSKSELHAMQQAQDMERVAANYGYPLPPNSIAGKSAEAAASLSNTEGSSPDDRFWENYDRTNIAFQTQVSDPWESFLKENPEWDTPEGKERFFKRPLREMSSIGYENDPDRRTLMRSGGNGLFKRKNNNMNLKYRQGANMQRLGELVKKYRAGGTDLTGDGVDYEEGKKGYNEYAADEGFQAFLKSTGGQYSPEYSGEALHTGGGSGSVRNALGDNPYANMAVDPSLLPLGSGYGNEEYGGFNPNAGPRGTRGDQMQSAADMFANNRQMEINYEAWLTKQKKPGGRAEPVYEVLPGAKNAEGVQTRSDGVRITGGRR